MKNKLKTLWGQGGYPLFVGHVQGLGAPGVFDLGEGLLNGQLLCGRNAEIVDEFRMRRQLQLRHLLLLLLLL